MHSTETFSLPLADANVMEAFYRAQTNTRTRFLQMSPGRADLDVRRLDLGPVRLLEATGEGRHLWQDEMLADEWRVALLREAEGAAHIGGVEVTPTLLTVVRPGEALGLATSGRYRTLEINVSTVLVEQNGWAACTGISRDAPGALVLALAATAEAAFSACDAALPPAMWPANTDPWAAVVIDQLDRVFHWWATRTGSAPRDRGADARADIALRATRAMRDADYAKRANVEALCRDIGVSRRGLFLAFQKQLGVGPRRFNELVRLHTLRSRLYRAAGDDTTVTAEAEQLGFGEMGRLARKYRDVFGEAPSETLRRRA